MNSGKQTDTVLKSRQQTKKVADSEAIGPTDIRGQSHREVGSLRAKESRKKTLWKSSKGEFWYERGPHWTLAYVTRQSEAERHGSMPMGRVRNTQQ